jgi:glycosyltransferase involved in cell wall biosynthesis
MSTFAIILLSNGTFGGAQRRFTNLFLEMRIRRKLNVYFIVTPSMKRQIAEIFGNAALDGVLSIGEDFSSNSSTASAQRPAQKLTPKTAIVKKLKHTIFYKIYYYCKIRKLQFRQFREVDYLAKQYSIDRFLAVYTGVLPLYFYFDKPQNRPKIFFVNMDSWFSHLSETPQKDWHRQYDLFNRAHAECDKIDILSPFILDGLQQRGINLHQDRFSITACSFTDYSRCKIGDKSRFSVVFAARLEKDKNPLDFVEASLELANEFQDVQFHIAGDGRLAGKIREQLESRLHSNIKFHGFLDNPAELFAESSLFVSIQSTNNYPSQAVLEAMACGNAVIATDVGDTRLFVNNENGFLISPGVQELTRTLRQCLQNRELVLKKGHEAANFVRKNFTIERAVDYYMNLIYPKNENK